LQAIVVEKTGKKYKIVAGHRRFEACKKLGHKTIQASVKAFDGKADKVFAQITENVSRVDISLEELGIAFKDLKRFKFTDLEMATRLGISIAQVKQAKSALTVIPKEFHNKIKREARSKKNEFSFKKANSIISAAKEFSLKRPQIKLLTKEFATSSPEKIRLAAAAMSSGKEVKTITKAIDKIALNNVRVMVNRTKKAAWERKNKKSFVVEAANFLKKKKEFNGVIV